MAVAKGAAAVLSWVKDGRLTRNQSCTLWSTPFLHLRASSRWCPWSGGGSCLLSCWHFLPWSIQPPARQRPLQSQKNHLGSQQFIWGQHLAPQKTREVKVKNKPWTFWCPSEWCRAWRWRRDPSAQREQGQSWSKETRKVSATKSLRLPIVQEILELLQLAAALQEAKARDGTHAGGLILLHFILLALGLGGHGTAAVLLVCVAWVRPGKQDRPRFYRSKTFDFATGFCAPKEKKIDSSPPHPVPNAKVKKQEWEIPARYWAGPLRKQA